MTGPCWTDTWCDEFAEEQLTIRSSVRDEEINAFLKFQASGGPAFLGVTAPVALDWKQRTMSQNNLDIFLWPEVRCQEGPMGHSWAPHFMREYCNKPMAPMAGTTGVKCLDFLLGPLNTPYNAVHAWVWLGEGKLSHASFMHCGIPPSGNLPLREGALGWQSRL